MPDSALELDYRLLKAGETHAMKMATDPEYRLFSIVKQYESGRTNGLAYHADETPRTTMKQFIAENQDTYVDPDKAIALMGDEPLKDSFNFRALTKLLKDLGQVWRPQSQQRGTCVSQGSKTFQDDFLALDAVEGRRAWEGRACCAWAYGGGRVEIANQPGRWDGSNSDWACDFLVKFGVLLMKELGLGEDDRDADEALAVKWAADRQGVPANYEAIGKQRMLFKSWTQCRSYEEVHRYIQAGHSIVNDSQMWASGRKDADGFSPVSSQRGGHCQVYRAARVTARNGILNQNSWSELWSTGGNFPDDQPAGSVWEEAKVIDARCKAGNTIAMFPLATPAPRSLDYSLFSKRTPVT